MAVLSLIALGAQPANRLKMFMETRKIIKPAGKADLFEREVMLQQEFASVCYAKLLNEGGKTLPCL